ncbi:MAG: hypothetical protein A2475_03960 [Ignavibacteria bacterium RIFOXYC2_FULL_35_21]|nr:MAG: hypothetical protein A2220_03010 [Ignavibacteria bacterium RIFOXYA2_FULL_35_10]OGV21718.1 MAG: hypothetical protein A2475_03960 [Ignavibacteria bacterium RIFOXYC2_FULL_35_21]
MNWIDKLKAKPSIGVVIIITTIINVVSVTLTNLETISSWAKIGYHCIFPPKFSINNNFHILILPFEKISVSEIGKTNIEKVLQKRFIELSEINYPIEVIYDDYEDVPQTSIDAKKIGEKRNADIVIYGEYYINTNNLSNDVRIKWVLTHNFHTYLGFEGDSKVQPIKRLSEFSEGFLLKDIDYIIWWNLSISLFEVKQYKISLKVLFFILNNYKEYATHEASLHHVIAQCYDYLGDYENAKKYYFKTIGIDSNYKPAYNNLAIKLAWNFYEFDSAKYYFNKVLEKEKNNSILFANYAWLLQEHYCDYKNAIVYYQKAIKIDKRDTKSLYNLAYINDLIIKNYKKAKYYYEQALKIEPENSFLLEQYGIFLGKKLSDFENAIKYHNQAIKYEPNYGSPYNSLANIYLLNGDIIWAIFYFKQAIKHDSTFPEPYTVYGVILYNYLNDTLLGKKYLLKSVELFDKNDSINPNRIMGYYNLAMYYEMCENNFYKTEELLLRALEINKRLSFFINMYTPILTSLIELYYFRLNNYDKAQKYYSELKYLDIDYKNMSFDEFISKLQKLKKESPNNGFFFNVQ